jgi:hypothetical protein
LLLLDRSVVLASGLALRLVPDLQLVPVVGVHEAETELDEREEKPRDSDIAFGGEFGLFVLDDNVVEEHHVHADDH